MENGLDKGEKVLYYKHNINKMMKGTRHGISQAENLWLV
jgi:hypothetical protein